MSNSELLKDLRALTQAGMKDCKDALEESNWDLQKAVDILKVKGLQNTSRSGRIASEGVIAMHRVSDKRVAMVEVNCQTDFVAKSPDFVAFAQDVAVVVASLLDRPINEQNVDVDTLPLDGCAVGEARNQLISIIKENIVIRRWWVKDVTAANEMIATYNHNGKIGVFLSLEVPTEANLQSSLVKEFADSIAMQIAAMNPLAFSKDELNPHDVERQKAIFETQLTEANKPQAAWPKIIEGKFRKWYSEACLLEQESVMVPKMTVLALTDQLSNTLCGEHGKVKLHSFIRAMVGEGIEVQPSISFAEEVEKMSGVVREFSEGPTIKNMDCIKN